MPDWPREWSLLDEEKNSRKSNDDTVPQKVCLQCTQPHEAFYKACPYCGFTAAPTGRKRPEQVDGDLTELDVEAMALLFAERQRANMSDEDYARQLLTPDHNGKIMPPKFHRQAVRRHSAAKYRRDVLNNLVGWWVGCQPADRDISEKYRRFYLRFGVDMSTAFTLNEKDTDALIERIKRGFKHDV